MNLPNAPSFPLVKLVYGQPIKGDHFRLYLYDRNGYHPGGIWFTSGEIKYPQEEVSARYARTLVEVHIREGKEVRITNAADELMLHAKNYRLLYPNDMSVAGFWEGI